MLDHGRFTPDIASQKHANRQCRVKFLVKGGNTVEAPLGGLRMLLVWISKPFVSRIEEKAMSLSVFYYCICVCLRRCRSFNPSLCRLSLFHLSYVAVSRPCCLSEFTLTGPHSDRDQGRFPFNQKFRKFRAGRWMEQKLSGIKFRNFGYTLQGCSNIPANQNNRNIWKLLFHSKKILVFSTSLL